ncbi:MAG: serine/threonine-protein kinase, partial [Planctomycetota bacterium]
MDESKILARCRALMDADRAAGRLRPMASYQNLFAGFEELVESVYESLDQPPKPKPKPKSKQEPAADPEPTDSRAAALLEHIQFYAQERYRYGGEIGEGAMGRVLEVVDQGLERAIAMKVLRDGDEGSNVPEPGTEIDPAVHRFIREARIMAQLDHPGIVPVYDFGINPDKRIFFTMKRVEGEELVAIINRYHERDPAWPLARVVQVLVRAADAIGFAHSRAIVHRDLKPANIMVGGFGEVYVMDWGLAKVLDAEEDERYGPPTESGTFDLAEEDSLGTRIGSAIGSPTYMPLEQAAGDLARIGPASDVYGLGACLYHLLAGSPPYVAGRGRPANALEVVLAVQKGPPEPLAKIAADAPDELLAIAEKAMARDAGDRYANGSEFGADLQAYLDGRVVSAHRTGPMVAASKWIARNRPLAGALAALLFLVVCGSLFVAIQQYRAKTRVEASRGRALAAAQKEREARVLAEQATAAEAEARASAEASRQREARARGEAEQAAAAERVARRRANGERIAAQATSLASRNASLALILGRYAARSTDGPLVREALATALDGLREIRTLHDQHEGYVLAATYAPDGKTVVTAGHDHSIFVWDAATGAMTRQIVTDDAWIARIRFAPDGSRFATYAVDTNQVRVYERATGKLTGSVEVGKPIGVYRALRLLTKQPKAELTWSPDGSRVLFVGRGGGTHLIDANTWTRIRRSPPRSAVFEATFSRDGARLALLRRNGTLSVVATADGKVLQEWANPEACKVGRGGWVRFRKEDTELVVGFLAPAETSGYVRRIADGELLHIRPRLGPSRLADDGRVWVTWARAPRRASAVTELVAHEIDGDRVRHRLELPGAFRFARAHPANGRIALLEAGRSNDGVVWNTRTGTVDARLVGHFDRIESIAWNRDGSRLVTGGRDFTARLWHAFDPRDVTADWASGLPAGHRIVAMSVAGDRAVLVWPDLDGQPTTLIELSTGRPLAQLDAKGQNPSQVTIAKGGSRLAIGFPAGEGMVWNFIDAVTGTPQSAFRTKGTRGVLSPDGARFAAWSNQVRISTYDVAKGQPIVGVPVVGPSSVRFAPDGLRLVTVDAGNLSDTLWDLEARRSVYHFRDRTGYAFDADWSPDGHAYVSTAADNAVFFRDTRTGKTWQRITRMPAGRLLAGWSPDARFIFAQWGRGGRIYRVEDRVLVRAFTAEGGRWEHAEFHPERPELWISDTRGRVLRIAIDVIEEAKRRAPRDAEVEELVRYRVLDPEETTARFDALFQGAQSFYKLQPVALGAMQREEFEEALGAYDRLVPTRPYLSIL